MNYHDPSNLAIIACPGGEAFADKVISHLEAYYQQNYIETVEILAKKYSLDRREVIQRFNFMRDTSTICAVIPEGIAEAPDFHFKTSVQYTLFANGEIKAEILESIRGKDIYIFQDMENHSPIAFHNGVKKSLTVNDNLMTALVTVDVAIQAGAGRVTLIWPIYPYSRQHKKKGREGLTAARIAFTMETLGVSRIITLDIHSEEIMNAFSAMRLENCYASYDIIPALAKIANINDPNLVVVSPDTGAVIRNRFYANYLSKSLAMLYKKRDYSKTSKDANETNIEEMQLLGDVEGMTVFMADDMLDTGGTLLKAMKFLKEKKAGKVICAISLPLFTGSDTDSLKAIKNFDEAYRDGLFYRIIGTNAIFHQQELLDREWYIEVDISDLFAQIISRLHESQSLSSLLDNREDINRLRKNE